jgi:hypothetical protein
VALPLAPRASAHVAAAAAHGEPGATSRGRAAGWLTGWALFFAAMLVLNLIWSAARYYVYARAMGHSFADVLATGSRGAAAHVLLFPLVYAANRRLLPRVERLSSRLGLHAILALGLSFAKSTLVRVFALLFGGPAPGLSIVTLVGVRIYSDVLHYALMAALCHALARYHAARAQAERAAALERELQTRVQALRGSLEPDQLFATLERLERLIESAPDEADRLIADLGDRLRAQLRESRSASGEAA